MRLMIQIIRVCKSGVVGRMDLGKKTRVMMRMAPLISNYQSTSMPVDPDRIICLGPSSANTIFLAPPMVQCNRADRQSEEALPVPATATGKWSGKASSNAGATNRWCEQASPFTLVLGVDDVKDLSCVMRKYRLARLYCDCLSCGSCK
jgi:hypothetical protein